MPANFAAADAANAYAGRQKVPSEENDGQSGIKSKAVQKLKRTRAITIITFTSTDLRKEGEDSESQDSGKM